MSSAKEETLPEKTARIKETRMADWFRSFTESTDQKQITSTTIANTIIEHANKRKVDELRILDVGCGNGVLAAEVMGLVCKNGISIIYFGLDKDKSFVAETAQRLKPLVKEVVTEQRNFVEEGFGSMPHLKVDIVLASHVLYYLVTTEQAKRFFTESCHALKAGGHFIKVHGSEKSDINVLGKDYKPPRYLQTRTLVEKYLKCFENIGMQYSEIQSSLRLPDNIDELWELLKSVSYEAEMKVPSGLDNSYLRAKNVLEFIVQTPLETLAAEGKLITYLEECQKMVKNGTALTLRDDLFDTHLQMKCQLLQTISSTRNSSAIDSRLVSPVTINSSSNSSNLNISTLERESSSSSTSIVLPQGYFCNMVSNSSPAKNRSSSGSPLIGR